MRTFFGIVLWIIMNMVLVSWCCELLTSRDTLLNIVAVVIFAVWIAISYKTDLLIKTISIFKKKRR